MSESTDHPDALAALYLRNRDVPCPGCGYNRRDATAAQCPECGHMLRFVPQVPNAITCRASILLIVAWSLLGVSSVSIAYFGVYGVQYFGPINPLRSALDFAFASILLVSVVAFVLDAIFLSRWAFVRHRTPRPTRLLAWAVVTFHVGWAIFLILAWISRI